MKNLKNSKLKRALAVFLVGTMCFIPGVFVFAEDDGLKVECESSPYTALQADEQTKWNPKATSTEFTTVSGGKTRGLVFTEGTVGARIAYTFISEIEGEYDFYFAARPNENYFCDVNVYLGGKKLNSETLTFRKDVTVAGEINYDNKVRDYNLGKTELIKGENTVIFEVVSSNPEPKSITIALDCFGFKKQSHEAVSSTVKLEGQNDEEK